MKKPIQHIYRTSFFLFLGILSLGMQQAYSADMLLASTTPNGYDNEATSTAQRYKIRQVYVFIKAGRWPDLATFLAYHFPPVTTNKRTDILNSNNTEIEPNILSQQKDKYAHNFIIKFGCFIAFMLYFQHIISPNNLGAQHLKSGHKYFQLGVVALALIMYCWSVPDLAGALC